MHTALDLAEPRGCEPLAGHRHQPLAVEHAHVAAELDGTDREGAGTGELHQREHLADVAGPERRDASGTSTGARSRSTIWCPRPPSRRVHAGGELRDLGAEQHGDAARADHRPEVTPSGDGVVAQGPEDRDVGVVAGPQPLALCELLVGVGERVPDRVVEHGVVEHGGVGCGHGTGIPRGGNSTTRLAWGSSAPLA